MKLLVVAICVLAGQVFCDDFEDASEHRRLEHPDFSKQSMLARQPPSYQSERQFMFPAAKNRELDLDKVLRQMLDLLRLIHDKIYGLKSATPVPFQPDRHHRGIEQFLENLKDRIRDRDSHIKATPFPHPVRGLEGLLQNIKDRTKPIFRPSGVDLSYAQRSLSDRLKKIRERFNKPDNSVDCVDSSRSDAVFLPHPSLKQQS